jgi:prepilin-type N-terminal cleavage/methylation domain-containing protein
LRLGTTSLCHSRDALRLSAVADKHKAGERAYASERNAGNPRRRDAFTLVEVIVVLVILAILAAIAVPALTGYIDKAHDKEYIAKARNISVAMKTVLNESYASGEIDRIAGVAEKNRFTVGWPRGKSNNLALFPVNLVSYSVHSDYLGYYKRAAALMGEVYRAYGTEGSWMYFPIAKAGSGATAATADGFSSVFFPEGVASGKPFIAVTYKLERLDSPAPTFLAFTANDNFDPNFVYNPNAGYEVYRLTQ